MLKENLKAIKKRQINYIQTGHHINKYTPWIGDLVNCFYDRIMEKSVFPGKFHADLQQHYDILTRELTNIHGQKVLELAAGSGNAVYFLPHDNEYTGIDISPGLLKKACRRFQNFHFSHAQFYLASAEDLPFQDNYFEVMLCHLSFNFFRDLKKVIQESTRVSGKNALFYGSVPIPERKSEHAVIRGNLFSEAELKQIFNEFGWQFHPLPEKNGALLYFQAEKNYN